MRENRTGKRISVLFFATLIAATTVSAQTAAGAGKSFLWKVTAGDKVAYLAGSIHLLSADVYPLSAAFERAFAASPTLVEEIDLGEADSVAAAPALLRRGMYLDGRNFDASVSRETAALVSARLKETGMPVQMFQMMKPWMVMLTISALEAQKAGLEARFGLDKHFYDRAMAAGKTIVGLETLESQIDRLDTMPEALQEQLLRSTLSELETSRTNLKAIIAAWRRGDAAAIERTTLSDFTKYPAAYRSLIVERNLNWIPQIQVCLTKTEPCLVVVGAAHLVGPDGLLALLQRKGYRLDQQ